MSIGAILLIVLVLLLVGAIPWNNYHSYGYGPPGVLGVVVIILLILLLMGKI